MTHIPAALAWADLRAGDMRDTRNNVAVLTNKKPHNQILSANTTQPIPEIRVWTKALLMNTTSSQLALLRGSISLSRIVYRIHRLVIAMLVTLKSLVVHRRSMSTSTGTRLYVCPATTVNRAGRTYHIHPLLATWTMTQITFNTFLFLMTGRNGTTDGPMNTFTMRRESRFRLRHADPHLSHLEANLPLHHRRSK